MGFLEGPFRPRVRAIGWRLAVSVWWLTLALMLAAGLFAGCDAGAAEAHDAVIIGAAIVMTGVILAAAIRESFRR
jgi:hypothetical protein